jgi:hypothetical protein
MELASITNNNNTPTLSLIIIIMPMEVACLKDIPSWEIGGMGGWLGFYDEDVDHIVWRESCRPSS